MTPIRYQNYAFLHFCYCKHAKSTVIISFLAVLILQTYKKHSNYMLFCTFDIKLQLLRAPGDLNPIGVAFAMALNSCGDSKHIGPQFMRGLLAHWNALVTQRKHNGNTTETQRKYNGNKRKHNGTTTEHNVNTTETHRDYPRSPGISPGPQGFPRGFALALRFAMCLGPGDSPRAPGISLGISPGDCPSDSPRDLLWTGELQCALAPGILARAPGISPGGRGFPQGFLPGIAPRIPPGIAQSSLGDAGLPQWSIVRLVRTICAQTMIKVFFPGSPS